MDELTRSQLAERHNIRNVPSDAIISHLHRVAEFLLEPVRQQFGIPFSPTSGYRSLALNRLLGSKDTSQHIRGQAVDFIVPHYSPLEVAQWMERHIEFDQLILEYFDPENPHASGWIHASLKPAGNRKQVLTKLHGLTHKGLPEGFGGGFDRETVR